MCLFPNVTPLFLDSIFSLLVPLFLTRAGDDDAAARHAAACMLASYDVQTEAEIRLAAEIAIFGFTAMDTLRASMDPNLSITAVLRLRGCANGQHRSAHQCQQALDKLRKQRHTTPQAQPCDTEPLSQDIADAPLPSSPTPVQPPIAVAMSRQQRRAMQRASEKAQRQQAEQARRDAMRAARVKAEQTLPAGHQQTSLAAVLAA